MRVRWDCQRVYEVSWEGLFWVNFYFIFWFHEHRTVLLKFWVRWDQLHQTSWGRFFPWIICFRNRKANCFLQRWIETGTCLRQSVRLRLDHVIVFSHRFPYFWFPNRWLPYRGPFCFWLSLFLPLSLLQGWQLYLRFSKWSKCYIFCEFWFWYSEIVIIAASGFHLTFDDGIFGGLDGRGDRAFGLKNIIREFLDHLVELP